MAEAMIKAVREASAQTPSLNRNNSPRVVMRFCKDAGTIPNSRLPVLLYPGVLNLPNNDPAAAIEALTKPLSRANTGR